MLFVSNDCFREQGVGSSNLPAPTNVNNNLRQISFCGANEMPKDIRQVRLDLCWGRAMITTDESVKRPRKKRITLAKRRRLQELADRPHREKRIAKSLRAGMTADAPAVSLSAFTETELVAEIAIRTGVSVATIKRIKRQQDDDIQRLSPILADMGKGMSWARVADKHGISFQYVEKIADRYFMKGSKANPWPANPPTVTLDEQGELIKNAMANLWRALVDAGLKCNGATIHLSDTDGIELERCLEVKAAARNRAGRSRRSMTVGGWKIISSTPPRLVPKD